MHSLGGEWIDTEIVGRNKKNISGYSILGMIVSCIGLAIIIMGGFFPYTWHYNFNGNQIEEPSGLQQFPACAILFFLIAAIFVGLFIARRNEFMMVFYSYQFFFIILMAIFIFNLGMFDSGWDIGIYATVFGFGIIEISSFIWKDAWKIEQYNDEAITLLDETESHN